MNQPSRVRVYYLASGALGIPCLEVLADSRAIELCGVGTQPDRPAGRKRQLQPTPVGERADQLGIPCERIPNVNDPAFLDRLAGMAPDILVVASFGQLLKERLIDLAPHGCLNIHASLLPRHRGASPIQAAILAGDRVTGISYMRIDAGLDTGPVYGQVPIDISPSETAGDLETRLAAMAAKHLEWVIQEIAAGNMVAEPQPPDGVTVARKIRKEAGRIDWTQSAEEIARQVRAYNPWPRCDTTVPGGRQGPKRLQITAAEAVEPENDAQPGAVLTVAKSDWVVACGLGALRILRVVPEGKSEMPAGDYLRGARIEPGTILGMPE
jgi:methionyl-tRNA formyltransferase